MTLLDDVLAQAIKDQLQEAVRLAIADALAGGLVPGIVPTETVEEAEVEVAVKAPTRKVVVKTPSEPATFRQRKMIAALSGVFPTEDNGFKGLTKGKAVSIIDKLIKGERVKVGGKVISPK
jgi:hypothetical protein